MKTVLQTILIGIVLLNFGCKEENNITGSGSNDLYNPNVMPKVIFTSPANNSVGPYNGLYSGGSSSTPHFRIQFNKIMSTRSLDRDANNISISGFDEPYFLYLDNSDSYSGIYQFTVRGENSYDPLLYQVGKKYTVTVSGNIEDVHGNKLGEPYSFSFTMEPALRVITALPKDSISYSSSQIAIAFNSQIDSSIFSSITISPALQGNWNFGSYYSSLYYNLSSNFIPNTTYTVTIASSAKDKFGNSMAGPFSYSFKSGEFRVLNSYPSNNSTGFGLNNELRFHFSSSVESASVQPAFAIDPAISGQFTSYDDFFYFTPLEPFKEKTAYSVTINTTLTATNGSTLAEPYTVSFITEGFRVYQVSPNYGSNVSRYTSIEVTFNAPVDTSTVAAGFSITPAVAGKLYFSNKNTKFVFRADSSFEVNTRYDILLSTSLKSAAGNVLESSYSASFTTGD